MEKRIIAILGGTGKEGKGLGYRWAVAGHEIVIGSRQKEKAEMAVAELLARKHPVPMAFVGVQDTFAESGDYEKLLEKYGLTPGAIAGKARGLVRGK